MSHIELFCNNRYIDQDMMEIKEFRQNFHLPEVIEVPDAEDSPMLYDDSYDANDLHPLCSTRCFEDDKYEKNISDDSLGHLTSTPERKIKSNQQKKIKLPRLVINEESGENSKLSDTMSCSPVRSPFLENKNFNLDDSLEDLDDTLTSEHYDTLSEEMGLDKREKKMVLLLKRFDLTHFAFIFIEQEIDIDLFLKLNDHDLQEIGIIRKSDRKLLLSVIEECNRRF